MNVSKIEIQGSFCPELRGAIKGMAYPAFAEVKIDGEFAWIHLRKKGDCFTVNKYGKVRKDFPALNKLRDRVLDVHESATMMAELYYADGKNGSFYQFLSNKENDALELYVHDILELDSKDYRNVELLDRKELLSSVIDDQAVACKIITDELGANAFFQFVCKQGYEGVVLKPVNSKIVLGPCQWVKMKYKDQNDYEVVTIDPVKERVEISVPYATAQGISNVIVGLKAANRYKRHIKMGEMVTVEHQGVLESGSLRHPTLIAKKEWK